MQTWLVSLLPGRTVLDTATAYLFPGFLTLVLAAAALILRPASAASPGSEDPGLHESPLRATGIGRVQAGGSAFADASADSPWAWRRRAAPAWGAA